MKIALITPPTKEYPISRDMAGGLGFDRDATMLLPPLDFVYAASQLQLDRHEVLLIDGDHPSQALGLLSKNLEKFSPDVALVMVSLPTLDSDCSFANKFKKQCKCRVIVKTGISHQPLWQDILSKSGADFLVFGECERQITKMLSRESRAGTAWVDHVGFQWQPPVPLLLLDSLPPPNWSLLGQLSDYRYSFLGKGVLSLQTSRGCPFSCSYYCPYPLVQGRQWRGMSSDRMIAEILSIRDNGITRVLFRDAVFTYDADRTIRFCEHLIQKKLSISWWCESRADCLSTSLLAVMKKAGCKGINVGVESGDARVRRKLGKTGLKIPHLRELLSTAGKIGLKIHLLFMAGLPDENRKSLYDTYSLIKLLRPDSFHITMVTPYPGTPLFHDAQAKQLIPEFPDWQQFGGHSSIIPTKFLSKSDLLYGKKWIDRLLRFRMSANPLRRLSSLIGELWFSHWARGK